MTQNSAYFVSFFTAGLLVVMFAVILVRPYLSKAPVDVKGVPVAGFQPSDGIIAFIVILFYAIRALTFYQSPESAEPDYSVRGLLTSYLALAALSAPVVIRLSRLKYLGGTSRIMLGILLGMSTILIVNLCGYLIQETGLVQLIIKETGAEELQDSVKAIMQAAPGIKLATIAGAVIVAPFIEEVIFRGYVYPFCKRFAGAAFAAVSTSLLFSIVHTSLVHAIPLFLLSLMLTFCYERTKSIWVPIFTHMAFNMITVLHILLFPTDL